MPKAHFFAALALALCAVSICFSSVHAQSASVQIMTSEQTYAPGKPLEGIVNIRLKEYMSEGQLRACIGSSCPQITVDLSTANPQSRQYAFTYKIFASGESEWVQYPEKSFDFRIKAEGTCGNPACHSSGSCECNGLCQPSSTPPYSCPWEVFSSVISGTANEAWSVALDARNVITPPQDSNGDTKYSELINNPSISKVQTTLRTSCGSTGSIWIQKTLTSFEGIPGGTKRKASIGPFDETSLAANRQLLVDGSCTQPYVCGGIYMNGNLLASGYTANGTTGEIILDSYNPNAVYIIVYLPRNGPMICARSSLKVTNSTKWDASSTNQSGSVAWDKPFSKVYTQAELPYVLTGSFAERVTAPACPLKSMEEQYNCTKKVNYYYASKTSDSSGGRITFNFNEGTRTASATVYPQEIEELVKSVNLSGFYNLKAPSSSGEYSLRVTFSSGGSELATDDAIFYVCTDSDRDGWCRDSGCKFCGDCNDNNPNIRPGAIELCNGLDDNCDGAVDEPFQIAGRRIGTSCGVSICNGTWSCSPDMRSVICNNVINPGDIPEICDNGIDDDCDGERDEYYQANPQNVTVVACVCKDGEKKACGSNVGECRMGNRYCVKGVWTETCLNAKGPSPEICNGKDDDCDGIIDDMEDSTKPSETLCACTGEKPERIAGIMALSETCGNGIDDNCDGQMEEDCVCVVGERP
jgi:hypothetical protein